MFVWGIDCSSYRVANDFQCSRKNIIIIIINVVIVDFYNRNFRSLGDQALKWINWKNRNIEDLMEQRNIRELNTDTSVGKKFCLSNEIVKNFQSKIFRLKPIKMYKKKLRGVLVQQICNEKISEYSRDVRYRDPLILERCVTKLFQRDLREIHANRNETDDDPSFRSTWISDFNLWTERFNKEASCRANERTYENPLRFTFTYAGSMHSRAQLQRHDVHIDAGRRTHTHTHTHNGT